MRNCVISSLVLDLISCRLTVLEDELGPDDKLAFFCARVDHLQQGWKLVHMLDSHGQDSGAVLLARFSINVN